MSWVEYYRQPANTIGKHNHAYIEALNNLTKNGSGILDKNTPKNIVLGGFHNSKTVSEFKQLCHEQFTNKKEFYLLDMNRRPLASLESKDKKHVVQARLENLPFAPGSIDLMFLDFTLFFMKPQQVEKFFNEAGKVLKTSGLVLATYYSPNKASHWNQLENTSIYNSLGVPIYYHEPAILYQSAEPLKPVFSAEFNSESMYLPTASIAVFAKPASVSDKRQTIIMAT